MEAIANHLQLHISNLQSFWRITKQGSSQQPHKPTPHRTSAPSSGVAGSEEALPAHHSLKPVPPTSAAVQDYLPGVLFCGLFIAVFLLHRWRRGASSMHSSHYMSPLRPKQRRPLALQAQKDDNDEGENPSPPAANSLTVEPQAGWRSNFAKLTIDTLGVEPSGDLFAITLVYFVQGALGLAELATSFYLKDTLQLDPAEAASLTGIAALPWVVKPLWGFLSDSVPIFGSRRQSYLAICGAFGAAGWLAMATVVNGPISAVIALTASSLGVAAADVVVDSLVVERSRDVPIANAGALQSLCWGSRAIGSIIAAFFAGSLVQEYGAPFVFGVTALFPLMTVFAALAVKEASVNSDASAPVLTKLQSQGGALWAAVKQPSILLPTVFIALWQATPSASNAMFYFTTNQLGFDAEFLGRVAFVTSLASLGGVALYNTKLKAMPLKSVIFWTTILGTILGLTQLLLVTGYNRQLGISDQFFSLGDSVILTVLGQVAFMPVLVLAARICPPGIEATLFAGLMSLFNAAGILSRQLGALLTAALGVTSTEFGNLALLITICNLSSLLPLPFLGLLDSVADEPSEESQTT